MLSRCGVSRRYALPRCRFVNRSVDISIDYRHLRLTASLRPWAFIRCLAADTDSPLERAIMRRAIVVALLLLLPGLAVSQETKKKPIPSKEAQAKIEALLQELYKDDFAKAEKDAVLRGRLA